MDWKQFRFCWNQDLVNYLKQQKDNGRTIVLVTGAHEIVALKVIEQMPFIDEVLATTDDENLTGLSKAKKLEERFGKKGFDYIGNEAIDLAVWRNSRKAFAVNCGDSFFRRMRRDLPELEQIHIRQPQTFPILKAIRPYQWVKNILVFLPLAAGHLFFDVGSWINAIVMAIAFSCAASAFYIFNDLLDLHADRDHPTKRNRPIASGQLMPLPAIFISATLFIMGCLMGFQLGQAAFLSLLSYVALNFAYTIWLKSQPLLDVIALGSLYTNRVIAGGFAVGAPVSSWLLAFSVFIFLSLGLVKRFTELTIKRRSGGEHVARRGYYYDDANFVFVLGLSTGLISVLILALYFTSETAEALYSDPLLLWTIIPVVFYWISRIWLIAHRRQLSHDPVLFAVKDPTTYVICALIACIAIISM